MKSYSVRQYQHADKKQWNQFLNHAKNSTFLFHRDFMEYHSDRFEDFSLMLFENYTLIALFPANRVGDKVVSHQGLTYGGLILKENVGGKRIYHMLNELVSFLKKSNCTKLFIKNIPPFYHHRPSNELTFFLSEHEASIYRRDLNLAIDYHLPLNLHKTKRKNYRKASSLGLEIREVNHFSPFWNEVLIPRLEERYDVKPVHTVEEISLLKERFPDNIHQYNVYLNDNLLAGLTLFQTGRVVKSQYGATTSLGEGYRAMDYLFITLIHQYKKKGFDFFDMGTVDEKNFGLLKQKEELGCDIYTQDFYQLEL